MDERPSCCICGGTSFAETAVLWPALIDQWQLSPAEAAYIDRQQGRHCTGCGANLRSIALARALLSAFGTNDLFAAFVDSAQAASWTVLELNTAGSLHPYLARLPAHRFGAYPEVDMHALPYPDMSFDIVVHSDTLEHVPNPRHALAECRRVIRQGGCLCFTVPIVVGRMSRGREGLPKSHHGNPAETGDDYVVQTEFGADAWAYVVESGFPDVRLFAVEFPAAVAMTAYRRG